MGEGNRAHGGWRRASAGLLASGIALSSGTRAAAQAPAGATVTGTVRERLNDVGLPLATVSLEGTDRVVFTRAGGAFAMAGVSAGAHTFRVRQIGFAPTTLRVTVPDAGTVAAGVARLERLPVSLASIEVRAQPSECVGTGLLDPGADSMATVVLARLGDQSDRLRAFAATYPGVRAFVDVRQHLDADSAVLDTRTDSARRSIVDTVPYRVGQVTHRVSGRNYAIHFPSAAQLSSAEFVAHHCARYAGARVVDGDTLDVLEIAPTHDVHSTDVAGTVLLTRDGVLRQTELRVTDTHAMGIQPTGGGMESYVVTSVYRPILDGRVSILSSIVSLYVIRTPFITGHRLKRIRDQSRMLWYAYDGERPAGDTTALAAIPVASR